MTEWLFGPTRHRVMADDVIDVVDRGESVGRYAVRLHAHAEGTAVSFEREDLPVPPLPPPPPDLTPK